MNANEAITESMKAVAVRLERGLLTIQNAESELNGIITKAMLDCKGTLDERLEIERKLKRRAWRMLLEATK